MHVKGAAFISREQEIIRQFGEPRWREFLKRVSEKDDAFKKKIVTTALIPMDSFLFLQNALAEEFYKGVKNAHWLMGERSAEWSLTEGPYKIFLKLKDKNDFLSQLAPKVWSTYFTRGRITVDHQGDEYDIKICDTPIWHEQYEYTIMGYLKKALELYGKPVKSLEAVKSVAKGDKEIHYRLSLDN